MTTVRALIGAIVTSLLAAPLSLCQILVPPPTANNGNENACLMSDTSQPSASAARCDASAHLGNLMDAGNHLFTTLGVLGGYDSAFDSKEGLSAPFQGGVVYAGLLAQRSKTFNVFENTASVLDYRMNRGTLQYLDSATASLTHQSSPRTSLGFYASNLFGNDAIRSLEVD